MSFEPPTTVDRNSYEQLSAAFLPTAPSPGAPPPPPPSTPLPPNNYSSIINPFSPNIVNYDDHVEASPASRRPKRSVRIEEPTISSSSGGEQPIRTFSSTRGDVTLRPNIGASNARIGEESLTESLWRGRVANIVACTVALLLEIPNLLGHVFRLHPARAVLGMYLSFFALLLCGYEIDLMGRAEIKHYFGMVHHPVGRSFLLFLMGGLAIGQGGILDLLLGVVFCWSSFYTIITYCWYPQYRQQTTLEEGDGQRQSLYRQALQHNAWANPAEQHVGEAISLLRKATSVPL